MNVRRTRNDQKFYYCLYQRMEQIQDEYGNESGTRVIYGNPVEMWANISPASGIDQTQQFGNLADYDKVIVTTDIDCPIDEHTVLFVDKEPEHNLDNDLMFDYIVKRVARSINSISIAISKVKVT